MGAFALIFYMTGFIFGANLLVFLIALGYLNRFFITPVLIKGFQDKVQPFFMGTYEKTLRFALTGNNSYWFTLGISLLLILSFVVFMMFPTKVSFFPSGEPSYIYTYIEMPIGTDAKVTDSVAKEIEDKIYSVVGFKNPIVNSVITNVGIGAGDPFSPDRTVTPNKAKVTIAFEEYNKRIGISTSKYLERIQKVVRDIPGAKIKVEEEKMGPPTGKPVNIEISGDNFETLKEIQAIVQKGIKEQGIQGIEKLTSDLQESKPEILIEVDKARANSLGISSGFIGMTIRTAIYGKESTKFKDDRDEYPVQIRLAPTYRNDINSLMNMPITFRDNQGQLKQIPVSSIAKVSYINSYASIIRKNQKRTLSLSSNVTKGFTAPEINAQLTKMFETLAIPNGYTIQLTGEQENQQEIQDFLGKAFLASLFIILIILVTQFNSISKPIIILTQVVLSIIGVLIGFVIFRFEMSIVFTGIGIVALAGIVVRNGIVLIDFIEEYHKIEKGNIRNAIILGGLTRFNAVVLTATATVLALIPLGIGFNINFISLFESFDPKIFFGGDSTAFWSPLAWAIVFGLSFATFLTLIIVPCLYFINYAFAIRLRRRIDLRKRHKEKKLLAKMKMS
jgi:multidrug efflux pump subunit AcrB